MIPEIALRYSAPVNNSPPNKLVAALVDVLLLPVLKLGNSLQIGR